MFDIDFSRLAALFAYDSASPMIFSSGLFLFLFLGFTVVYGLLAKRDTARIVFVTLFSYYFYYKSSGIYFLLLATVTLSDYYLAHLIDRQRHRARLYLWLSVIIDLGLLGYFKYTNFFGALCFPDWQHLDIFLPVGVSFFTFQSLSYTIDVYRQRIKPLNSPLDYAFYVSFFPQLVAGPIVRARDFIPQIRKPLVITRQMVGTGLFFILSGLFKKAVISDYLSLNFVDRIFENPAHYTGVENLLGIYGYAIQIYCDFSGYSDMAIGIALTLGFTFPINFNNPYRSRSITEFWRRWHISLSSWLRDYLYISLGGNRKGKLRQYLNLVITMLLGGLWHGASLNFVLWGGIHGVFLSLDKMWHSLCPRFSPLRYLPRKPSAPAIDNTTWKARLYGVVCGLVTFHIVAAAWVLFRASSFETASSIATQIFTNFCPGVFLQWFVSYKYAALLLILGFVLHFLPERCTVYVRDLISRSPMFLQALYVVVIVIIVVQIKTSEVQPFIYFQF